MSKTVDLCRQFFSLESEIIPQTSRKLYFFISFSKSCKKLCNYSSYLLISERLFLNITLEAINCISKNDSMIRFFILTALKPEMILLLRSRSRARNIKHGALFWISKPVSIARIITAGSLTFTILL